MDEAGNRYEVLRIVLFGHEIVAQRIHDGMLVCRVRLLVYGEQAVAQPFQQYGIGRHHRTERIGQFDVFVESQIITVCEIIRLVFVTVPVFRQDGRDIP